VSTVDGLGLSENADTLDVNNLEGLLRTVQRLKIRHLAFDDLEEVQNVGIGETFTVVECRYVGKSVAVKHIKLEHATQDAQNRAVRRRLRSVLREISIMHHAPLANHPNILSLIGYGWKLQKNAPRPYVVVEYGREGSFRSYLASQAGQLLPLKAKMILGGDVASGLMALHQCGIVHGDLKLDNVIIFQSWDRPSGAIAKLSDFGHSIVLSVEDKGQQKYFGTTLYALLLPIT
jgi:serine/threonine protein kinase